jgi:hypothetical protein
MEGQSGRGSSPTVREGVTSLDEPERRLLRPCLRAGYCPAFAILLLLFVLRLQLNNRKRRALWIGHGREATDILNVHRRNVGLRS